MKNRRLTAWAFSFIPLIITLIVLPMLPDTIPAHYGISGDITRYGSKYEMLVLPLLTAFMGLFWVFIGKFMNKDNAKRAQNEKILFWCDIVTTLIFTSLTVVILHLSYTKAENISSGDLDLMKVMAICLSISWILLGNVLPKCKQNRIIGFRTNNTLSSENTWYKTHRFGGKIFLIDGIISTLLCLFVFNGVIGLSFALGSLIVILMPIFMYSNYIYKKEG